MREMVTDESGETLSDGVDYESGRFMAFVGQSPLLDMQGIHRVLTEYSEMVAHQIERWASGKVIVQGDDGFVDLDLSREDGAPNYVGPRGRVEVIKAPVFPGDQQAYMTYLQGELAKVSHSRMMYGLVGPTEAAITLDILRDTSNRILGPIIDQMEMIYTANMDSILGQLKTRGKQYDKPLRSMSRDKRGRRIYDYIRLADIPPAVDVVVELQGAGVHPSQAQRLQVASTLMNARKKVASDDYIRDEVVGIDDPHGEEQKIFWEDLANNEAVKEMAGPVVSGLELPKKFQPYK